MTQNRTRAIVEAAEELERVLNERAETHVVGRNAELRDVEYLIEHGGGTDSSIARECIRQLVRAVALSSPQWTRTPPSEPGWYWLRVGDETRAVLLVETIIDGGLGRVLDDGFCDDVPNGEWWPIRIEEPPG